MNAISKINKIFSNIIPTPFNNNSRILFLGKIFYFRILKSCFSRMYFKKVGIFNFFLNPVRLGRGIGSLCPRPPYLGRLQEFSRPRHLFYPHQSSFSLFLSRFKILTFLDINKRGYNHSYPLLNVYFSSF